MSARAPLSRRAAIFRHRRQLEQLLPEGEDCRVKVNDRVEFIDQGENLSSVACPACGRVTRHIYGGPDESLHEWMSDLIERTREENVLVITTPMPCCGAVVPFTALTFDWPAGFARFRLMIDNPQVGYPVAEEIVRELEGILGCSLKQVWAHY
jgi:hypothetical protein